MVAQSDLAKANMLNAGYNSITAALNSFDNGGSILQMTVGVPQENMPPMGVMVDTTYMFEHVPPQMIETIKQLMHARQDEISQELQAMGVQVTQPRAARRKSTNTR